MRLTGAVAAGPVNVGDGRPVQSWHVKIGDEGTEVRGDKRKKRLLHDLRMQIYPGKDSRVSLQSSLMQTCQTSHNDLFFSCFIHSFVFRRIFMSFPFLFITDVIMNCILIWRNRVWASGKRRKPIFVNVAIFC